VVIITFLNYYKERWKRSAGGPQNKCACSTDGRRTTIADERNPSKTKELDWSYTPRKLTIENSSRREDGRKKNKREAKDQDA